MPPTDKPTGERIAKLLARAGVASRREIERMIADRRIARNGAVIETPATILETLAGVTVDGKPVAGAEQTRLFRFHKPGGLITAESDPAGRPTIYAALRNALPPGTPRVMPVGRLDLSTEGLLLLTNDGGFKRELELPATGVPRTYRARTFGIVSQSQLEDLMDGITVEGVHYGPINANLERRTGRNQWIELTLTEGKNREVRRVLEHLGLKVSRLLRTAYGPFVLGDLAKGAVLEVRRDELERFRGSLKSGGGGRVGENPRHERPSPSASKPATGRDSRPAPRERPAAAIPKAGGGRKAPRPPERPRRTPAPDSADGAKRSPQRPRGTPSPSRNGEGGGPRPPRRPKPGAPGAGSRRSPSPSRGGPKR